MTDRQPDAALKRYDFIADTGRNFKVDLRISEQEGDWVRYEDIEHLLALRSSPSAPSRDAAAAPVLMGGQHSIVGKESPGFIHNEAAPGDDARDAARYRWLRGAYSIMPGAPGKRPIEWYLGTEADAAIDKAMLDSRHG